MKLLALAVAVFAIAAVFTIGDVVVAIVRKDWT